MLYAIFITARKLGHYFQAHPISIITAFPLKDVMFNEANMAHRQVGARANGL